jgi:hypothetical protein
MLQPDRRLIAGRYCVHARIGSGRLGEIFSATDEKYEALGVEQHVAIQILPDIAVRNNTLFNRISGAYETLRAAPHPNIVNYLHVGRDGEFGFLVMELLDGASLRRLLDEAGSLPLDEAIPVIRGAGEALQYLHARGEVHGNVIGRNTFITGGLDVRLLDVVPLGGGEAIFRGNTMSGSSKRATADDDVFALACLAYEMLAGRHPFNHSGPVEAGREPDRIVTLGGSEWDALRRALSFDRKERISSVADFMRAFGIRGTERLRSTIEHPDGQLGVSTPDVEEESIEAVRRERPVSAINPNTSFQIRRAEVEPVRDRTSPLRAVVLGTLLAGLAAWFFYGQPEKDAAELIAYLNENLNIGLTGSGEETVESPSTDSSTMTSMEPVDGLPTAAAPETSDETMPAEPTAGPPEGEPAISTVDIVLAPPQSPDSTGTRDDEAIARADSLMAYANREPVIEATVSSLIESSVSVSEHDGAARVPLPRIGNAMMQLVWWTSDHTAVSDADFIPMQQQVADRVSNDVLRIPLVNDSLPEPRESFFVNFGRHDMAQGRIERVATVRVDIEDDDSR